MTVIKPALRAVKGLSGERRAVGIARGAVTGIFGAIFAINLGAFFTAASHLPLTHLSAALLALYLLGEARLHLRHSDTLGLLSPAFLALIFHFVLSYLLGITVSVFLPWVMQRFYIWLPGLDDALSGTLILAGLAAFCMLRGYAIGQPLARMLRRSAKSTPLLRRDMRPRFGLVLGMQAFFILLVVYAIDLGVYGLLGTAETRERHFDVVQLLNLGLAAGTLSYFLILLRHFERRAEGRTSFLKTVGIGVLIAVHVIAGALSAFKSQIAFPFVLAGFAYFLMTRRMPLRFVGYACVALLMAYVVIEPFRGYLALRGTPPASLTEAVDAIATSFEMREQLSYHSDLSRAEAIASRFDLAGMTALAIDYVDRGDLQGDKRAEFQDSILLAPILAYVPRAVWPNKPSYSQGVWFNQNVRGSWSDERTSVGMGPIGYLYMAGGVTAVVLGFLGFGILQALIFDGFARAGPGGLIMFFGVASSLIIISSSFGPAVTGILRVLPLAFVAQMILLRKSRGLRNDQWS